MNTTPDLNFVRQHINSNPTFVSDHFALMNTQGLQADKLAKIYNFLEDAVFDLFAVVEDWHMSRFTRKSHPFFLAASTPPDSERTGHQNGGLILFARPSVHSRISRISTSERFVRFHIDTTSYAVVYLEPSLSIRDFIATLTAVEDCDVILGDLNVRLGSYFGCGPSAPRERFENLSDWLTKNSFTPLFPTSGDPGLDHVLVKDCSFASYKVIPANDIQIDSDHPLLFCNFVNAQTRPAPDQSNGLRRPFLGSLKFPIVREQLASAYDRLAPSIDAGLHLTEQAIRSAKSLAERQSAIDNIDDLLTNAITDITNTILGTYDACAIKRKFERNAQLESLQNAYSVPEMSRIWKRAQRSRAAHHVSSDPARNAQDDFKTYWSDTWKAGSPLPTRPPDSNPEFSDFSFNPDGINDLFTASSTTKAIRSYPTDKSAGFDGIHIKVLQCLSFLSFAGRPESDHQFLSTQPDRSSNASPRPRTHFPFAEHLARFFSLITSAQTTPSSWGTAVVTMAVKDSSLPATPSNCRPIAGLKMFRRLYEKLLSKYFVGERDWRQLHPAQAGCRHRWSCLTTLLCSEYQSRESPSFPTVWLDISNAHASVKAEDVIAVLRKRNAPQYIFPLVWSILTQGSSCEIVVNDFRLPAIFPSVGLPQGSPLASIFFNFVIDDLCVILNERVDSRKTSLQMYSTNLFADDIKSREPNGEIMQTTVAKASDWCSDHNFILSSRKSALAASEPTQIDLYPGSPLRQTDSYKYLGMPDSISGLDIEAFLIQTVLRMDALLVVFMGSGGNWPSRVRLGLYRTFCLPIGDYGGPFFYYWVIADGSRLQSNAWRSMEHHYARAVSWITGMAETASNRQVLRSMTGLLPPTERFRHLTLSLNLHVSSAHPSNPCTALVRTRNLSSSSDLINGLRRRDLVEAFESARRRYHPRSDQPSVLSFRPSYVIYGLNAYFLTLVISA